MQQLTYRPSTPQQFAQWISAPRRWAAELFAALDGELRPVDFDGTSAWLVTRDTTMPSTEPNSVRLLPYFDACSRLPRGGHTMAAFYLHRAEGRSRTTAISLVADGRVVTMSTQVTPTMWSRATRAPGTFRGQRSGQGEKRGLRRYAGLRDARSPATSTPAGSSTS